MPEHRGPVQQSGEDPGCGGENHGTASNWNSGTFREMQRQDLTGMKEMEGIGRNKKDRKQLSKGLVYPLNPLYP
jgi:hypothetical protein